MNAKKLFALLLSVLMVLSLGMTVFAADEPTNPGSITIKESVDGKPYDLYKIFDLTGVDTTEPADGKYDKVAYTIASKWEGFFITPAAVEGEEAPAAAPGADYILDEKPADKDLNPISINGTTKYINITESNVAEFAQKALDYAAKNNIAVDKTVTGDGKDLTVSNLELGYYMVNPRGAADIKDSYASICSLTSTVPAAEIVIKADYPTIIKEITEENEEPTQVNEAAIGDIIPYTLTTKIPDMTGYTKYFFVAHDTLSDGLTLNNTVTNGKNTGFTVKVGDATLVEGDDYDVDIDGQSFRIIFKDMVNKEYTVGAAVTITYSATLNDNALINEANTNTATIEYSNNPSIKPESDTTPENDDDPDDYLKDGNKIDVTGESEESETETYTTSLTLLKVDGENAILKGAEFTLTGATNRVRVVTSVTYEEAENGEYYKLADGKYTKVAPVAEHVEEAEDGAYVVMTEGYELAEGQESFTIGEFTYRALGKEEPTTETRYTHIMSNADQYDAANKKYNKVVTSTMHTNTEADEEKGIAGDTVKAFVNETTGMLTFEGLGVGEYTLTESVTPEGYNTIDPITFTVSFDGESKTFSTEAGSTISLELTTIVNQSGSVLPETGGMGTVLFIAIGAVVVLGAGIILTAKKRLYNEG